MAEKRLYRVDLLISAGYEQRLIGIKSSKNSFIKIQFLNKKRSHIYEEEMSYFEGGDFITGIFIEIEID